MWRQMIGTGSKEQGDDKGDGEGLITITKNPNFKISI